MSRSVVLCVLTASCMICICWSDSTKPSFSRSASRNPSFVKGSTNALHDDEAGSSKSDGTSARSGDGRNSFFSGSADDERVMSQTHGRNAVGHDDDDGYLNLDGGSMASQSFDDGNPGVGDGNYFDPREGAPERPRTRGDEPADSVASPFLLDDDEGADGLFSTASAAAGDDDDGEYGQGSEKGQLYDAYNMLHTLAQDFQKPFDAPAVVVVGHQSSGKSALIEALMGFQFNQVGGGTKTRRPVALRMQYNPKCHSPRCFLQGEDGVERPKSLAEIQQYIESENRRLERDPVRCFDPREINIRMEYKYCPNMILIDTPGLISAPRTLRGHSNVQQRALAASAREAERLVVAKMRCPDYIILCVEDTSDWKHGATREVVQKADPDLSRTVIVQTKLDTKMPQFGTVADVEEFLRADIINKLSPHKLGGPYFTSIPSGRVGRGGIDSEEHFFGSDDDFVASCADSEESARAVVFQRLKTRNTSTVQSLLPRVGLSRLRGFLERRVDECYRRNVAKIVPLLQAEHANCAKRLAACEKELEALSVERLKDNADKFCDEFCKALKQAIEGSIIAPPSLFGETLHQEYSAAGSFHDIQSCPMAVSARTWDTLTASQVGNCEHRLYGGSQYHRVLREFSLATRCLRLPVITEDEIANAAGIGDTHDGVNFLRASCVISLEKARISFDPLLDALRIRTNHVMGKLCSVSEYMLKQKQERSYDYRNKIFDSGTSGNDDMPSGATDITHNPMFRQLVRTIFERFVNQCSDSVMARCRDDLTALTKFVTWDLHERSGGALRRSLPDHTDIVTVYQVAVKAASDNKKDSSGSPKKRKSSAKDGALSTTKSAVLAKTDDEIAERDYHNLLQLMEEAACSRDANRTNLVVGGLVQHIVSQWRETFCRSVTTKFNCFFLLPFVEDFQLFFRRELQRMYEGDLCDVFDLTAARRQLQHLRGDLLNESTANKRLQEKFDVLLTMMQEQQQAASNASGAEAVSKLRTGRTTGFQ